MDEVKIGDSLGDGEAMQDIWFLYGKMSMGPFNKSSGFFCRVVDLVI